MAREGDQKRGARFGEGVTYVRNATERVWVYRRNLEV